MKTLFTILLTLALTLFAHSDTTTSVKNVDPAAAAKLLASEKKPVVLDLRTPEEYSEGHIAGAKNIDFLASSFSEEAAKLDRKQPYLIHCKSGGRSSKSLAVFKKLGFEQIIHLDGGILAWKEAGQETVK